MSKSGGTVSISGGEEEASENRQKVCIGTSAPEKVPLKVSFCPARAASP